MPFSISFKSIFATAAALLVTSPTTAVAQLDGWKIEYQSFDTNFTQGATNDISLTYHIGTEKDWSIELFDEDCTTSITNMVIPDPKDATATTTNVPPGYDTLVIPIDLDKTNITSSNIWIGGTTNRIKMCVSLKLLSGTDIIKEE